MVIHFTNGIRKTPKEKNFSLTTSKEDKNKQFSKENNKFSTYLQLKIIYVKDIYNCTSIIKIRK